MSSLVLGLPSILFKIITITIGASKLQIAIQVVNPIIKLLFTSFLVNPPIMHLAFININRIAAKINGVANCNIRSLVFSRLFLNLFSYSKVYMNQ